MDNRTVIRQLYLECLGESILEKLYELHARYSSNGEIRDAMLALFGYPGQCLVCARPLMWETRDRIPDDVDPWFCSGCCPICDHEVAEQ